MKNNYSFDDFTNKLKAIYDNCIDTHKLRENKLQDKNITIFGGHKYLFHDYIIKKNKY
jgi:hypothetical protein